MDQVVATTGPQQLEALQREDLENFVTFFIKDQRFFFIKDQMFGIPVLKVQDTLTPDKIAPIPLAPPKSRGPSTCAGASSP